jgi:hypothetical protein
MREVEPMTALSYFSKVKNMEYMKGQILDTGVTFVMSIVMIGILIGVGMITLSGLASSQTGVTDADNVTKAGIYNSSLAVTNMSLQMPTIGTN